MVHDLHMLISSVSRPNISIFREGDRLPLDFAFAGPQSVRMAQSSRTGPSSRRDPHLRRALCADVRRPDSQRRARVRGAGRPAGEPVHRPEHGGHAEIAEAAAFSDGVVVVQVDEVVDRRFRASTSRVIGSTWSCRPTSHFTWSRCSRATRTTSATSRSCRRCWRFAGSTSATRCSVEPWRGLRDRRDRADPADLWRAARAAGQDLQAVDAQPAPDADSGDRVGMGRVDPPFGGEAGMESTSPPAQTSSSPDGRQPAVEPGAVPARGPVRSRHVHRVLAPGRPRCELFDSDRGAAAGFGGAPNMGTTLTAAAIDARLA